MATVQPDTIRAMLITGGHPYERGPFLELIASFRGIACEEATFPEAAVRLAEGRSAPFDAFVFYDFQQSMPPDSRRGFLDALSAGKGAVFLHHAICSQLNWPEYREIVGGFWDGTPFAIDGRNYGPSTAIADQELEVTVAHPSHPVTAGLADFRLRDEPYGAYHIAPSVTPLLRTRHPRSEETLAWAHYYEGTPIVYIQPGHGPDAYENPAFRRVVAQAIRWVAQG